LPGLYKYVEPAKLPPKSLARDDGRDGVRGAGVDDMSRKLDGGSFLPDDLMTRGLLPLLLLPFPALMLP